MNALETAVLVSNNKVPDLNLRSITFLANGCKIIVSYTRLPVSRLLTLSPTQSSQLSLSRNSRLLLVFY